MEIFSRIKQNLSVVAVALMIGASAVSSYIDSHSPASIQADKDAAALTAYVKQNANAADAMTNLEMTKARQVALHQQKIAEWRAMGYDQNTMHYLSNQIHRERAYNRMKNK